jgi:hypothetical protein
MNPTKNRGWTHHGYACTICAIVLSVLRCMDSDYPFGIFWPLCCLSFDVWILITPLVSFGHCVVCPSMYGFWLPLWYLLAIVYKIRRAWRYQRGNQNLYIEGQTTQWPKDTKGVIRIHTSKDIQHKDSDYPFGIFKLFLSCTALFYLKISF